MNYEEIADIELANHLAESVRLSRIQKTCIPVEYDTALKLIECGVQVGSLWNLTTRDGFSGTCYYLPMTNQLEAQRGLYMATKDTIALEVVLLPTYEAKFQYLKAIRYGARGGHCNFD